MNRPGFRRTSNGGHGAMPPSTRDDAGVMGAPFTQAQILQLMKSEFGRARRHGFALACLALRFDRVRELAERHGHELRDALRQALGRVAAERTRDHDHVGLLGDDRYVLLLPHATADEARCVAERIVAGCAALSIEIHGDEVHVTLSAGVVSNEDRDALFFDSLLSQAELALEQAERSGGGRVVVFERAREPGPVSPRGTDD